MEEGVSWERILEIAEVQHQVDELENARLLASLAPFQNAGTGKK